MLKPDFIQPQEWKTLLKYCIVNNVNPYLITAIGLHETGWGTLGWGKEGYILGVGCYSETNADKSLQGFDTQIAWATQAISKFFNLHPLKEEITEFAGKIWKPGDPLAWAQSVWSIYLETLAKYAPDFKDYKDIPEWARNDVLEIFKLGIINNPFGSQDFYRFIAVMNRIYKKLSH